jgi:hypothetical protein
MVLTGDIATVVVQNFEKRFAASPRTGLHETDGNFNPCARQAWIFLMDKNGRLYD